jgi:hypothetical protein
LLPATCDAANQAVWDLLDRECCVLGSGGGAHRVCGLKDEIAHIDRGQLQLQLACDDA